MEAINIHNIVDMMNTLVGKQRACANRVQLCHLLGIFYKPTIGTCVRGEMLLIRIGFQ